MPWGPATKDQLTLLNRRLRLPFIGRSAAAMLSEGAPLLELLAASSVSALGISLKAAAVKEPGWDSGFDSDPGNDFLTSP
jgi:hypothetical protein